MTTSGKSDRPVPGSRPDHSETEKPRGISRRRFLGDAIVLSVAVGAVVIPGRMALGQADPPRQPYRGTLRWIGHC